MALKDSLGRWGERYAALVLARKGMDVVDTNLRTPSGEVDLVAVDGDCLVVCEVKTRRGARAGSAGEAIDALRIGRLRRAAENLLELRPHMRSARVDAVLIDVDAAAISAVHVRGIE